MRREAALIGLTLFAFVLVDWLTLAALPWLGLSFGPVGRPLFALTLVRILILVILYSLFVLFHLTTWRKRAAAVRWQPGDQLKLRLASLWLINLALLAAAVYTMYFEPFGVRVSEIEVPGPALLPGRPLRIVHLSDIHVERITRREREMIEIVAALQPDLIVLTGDYLNIDYKFDPGALSDAREVLAGLSAPYGVYAVMGTAGVDPPEVMRELFNGIKIKVLEDESMVIQITGGEPFYLVGVSTRGRAPDSDVLTEILAGLPSTAYKLLLYHTPDVIEAANRAGVDLYLAGHTHGGQVRIPFYGAFVTFSSYGKQYEAGLYTLDHTRLYVSRGLGMEGLGLPRLRFLCPPEIVLITIVPPLEGTSQ